MLWQEKFPSNRRRHLISQVLHIFLYGTNELFNHLFPVLSMAPLFHFLSFSIILRFILFCMFSSSLFVIFLLPLFLKTHQHPCILLHSVYFRVLFGSSVLNKYQSLIFLWVMSFMLSVTTCNLTSEILTKNWHLRVVWNYSLCTNIY